jgi:hypothetical protein
MRENDRKVILESLRRSDARIARESALRSFYFSDVAYAAVESIRESEDRGGQLLDALAEVGRDFPGTEDDRVRFTLLLSDLLGLPESAFYQVHFGGCRTVYVRNAYSDEAYRRFAADQVGVTVAYVDRFRAAAEDVSVSGADFCILPYADGSGTRVQSVAALVEQNELKLTRLYRVGDEEAALTFGLYGRAVLPPLASEMAMMLCLPVPSVKGLANLLQAADRMGASLLSVDTLAPEATSACILTLAASAKARMQILLYLALFLPEGSLIGLYPIPDAAEE